MMSSDARDMMGLPSAGLPKPATAKVPKSKIRGPSGVSREVLDLNYEGAPPISIVAPRFKEKPKLPFKPRAWEETQFRNSARQDGLIFRHWRRKGDLANGAGLPVTPADSNAASEMDQEDKTANSIPDSYFAKYNVKIPRPQYTDEEYASHMKSDSWSKEETDYLVDLAIAYDLRWVVVSDRYDYKPRELPKENEDSMAITIQPTPRTQEDMKSRYYTIAAKAMSLRIPVEKMSSSEFETHERMLKYNPIQETNRKKYTEQLLARTEEEKHEEELLLKELSRIVINQEKLFNERKALYERLDAPRSAVNDHSTTSMYQTSSGLTHLMQNMLAQSRSKELEKKQKRQSAMGADDINQSSMDRHRQSLDNSNPNKRSSLGSNMQSQHRHLSPRDQLRFGVSYPTNERLVGGVAFRNERATKAAQAKSSVQTTRISGALAELNIPPRLIMPTAKVVAEYERLIEGVKGLLEVRKLSEKLEGEIKVWRAQKEQVEAKERGEDVSHKRGSEPAGDTIKDRATSSVQGDGDGANEAEARPENKQDHRQLKQEAESGDEGDDKDESTRREVQDDNEDATNEHDEDTTMLEDDHPHQKRDTNEDEDEAEEEEDEEGDEDNDATEQDQRQNQEQAEAEDEENDEDEDDEENPTPTATTNVATARPNADADEEDDEEDEEEEGDEEDETQNDISAGLGDDGEDEDEDMDVDAEADAEAEAAMQGEDADEEVDGEDDVEVVGEDGQVGDGNENDDENDDEEEDEEDEEDAEGEDEDEVEAGAGAGEEVDEEEEGGGSDEGDDVEGHVNGDGEAEDDGAQQQDGEETSAAAISAAARSMRKRSASVISAVSNKSSKRQRK